MPSSATPRLCLRLAIPAALLLLGSAAGAQATLEQQARFDREAAACINNSSLPTPQRSACLRAVGEEQERIRSAQAIGAANSRPPVDTPLPSGQSSDGRATLVQQSGTRIQPEPPTASPEVRTSTDGRATLVLPTDGASRISGSD